MFINEVVKMRKESVIDYGEYIVSEEILKMLNQGNNKQVFSICTLSRQEKVLI